MGRTERGKRRYGFRIAAGDESSYASCRKPGCDWSNDGPNTSHFARAHTDETGHPTSISVRTLTRIEPLHGLGALFGPDVMA